MALIGQIRKRSWLLIMFIGMGLALFIITSMFVGNQIPFLDTQNVAGSVNGETINWTDFQAADDALYSGSGSDYYARRNALWNNYFVESAIVGQEAEELGLGVSETEMQDLQFGPNPSPIVRQRVINQTGQFDPNQLAQIRSLMEQGSLNPGYARFWEAQKKEIRTDRLKTKLNDLVSKSMFTPTWMVEQYNTSKNGKATFRYVKVPFDEVDNSEVEVSDADLKNYLMENKAKYSEEEETRKINYVVFDVFPSREDSIAIRDTLARVARDFATATDDTLFVEDNEGIMNPGYYTNDLTEQNTPLSQTLADTLFNAPVGAVVGPYIDGNRYVVTKLMDRRVMPDSVDSRHILISATTPDQFIAAEKTLDSLRILLEDGTANWDTLAKNFSQDPGSSGNGGKYENTTPNQFVPEFSDLIFFKGNIGELYTIRTQFGVHLIEPLARKYTDRNNRTERVKISTISLPIVPSQETQEDVLGKAQDFMANNRTVEEMATAAESAGFTVETSNALKANDYLIGAMGSGETSRSIVRWAFDGNTKVGGVAPEVFSYQDPVEFFDNKYVVAGLRNVQDAGLPNIANVRDEILPLVRNMKKGEVIASKLSQDLTTAASTFNTQIDTASNVTFNRSFVTGVGNEPKVIGAAFNLDANGVSAPVVGSSGVFLIQLITKTEPTTTANIPSLRREASSASRGQVTSFLVRSMRKGADVEDNRARVY